MVQDTSNYGGNIHSLKKPVQHYTDLLTLFVELFNCEVFDIDEYILIKKPVELYRRKQDAIPDK